MNKIFYTLLILILIISCGKSKNNKEEKKPPQTNENNSNSNNYPPENPEGNYISFLRPLNNQVSGRLPTGKVFIKIKSNIIQIKSFLDDDAKSFHIQAIYEGSECPKLQHDINQDGLIDLKELRNSVGKILIPLDSNISHQEDGFNQFPKGPSYTYQEIGSYEDLIKNLYEGNEDEFSLFEKLKQNQPIRLHERVVIIHGTDLNAKIPDSFSVISDEKKHISIPIACGRIQKIKDSIPGDWPYEI